MSPFSCRGLTAISLMPCVSSTAQRGSSCRCVCADSVGPSSFPTSLPTFFPPSQSPSLPPPSYCVSGHLLLLRQLVALKATPISFLNPIPPLLWPPLAIVTIEVFTAVSDLHKLYYHLTELNELYILVPSRLSHTRTKIERKGESLGYFVREKCHI